MAVTLSSDLIMDVIRNADPLRQKSATARLEKLAAEDTFSGGFEAAIRTHEADAGSINSPALSLAFSEGKTAPREVGNPLQDFERFFLRNIFEALLPDSESGAFGTGASAGVWRTMAADQLAGVLADGGGIGMAGILAGEDTNMESQQGQWPYFSLAQISSFSG